MYRRRAALRLRACIARGRLRVTDALADLRVRPLTAADLARLDRDGMLLMNINTPQDLHDAGHRAPRSA